MKESNRDQGSKITNQRSDSPTPDPRPLTPNPAQQTRHDWNKARPEELPRPTWWPAVMALGITFIFWGVVTSYLITGVGLILFAMALAGWIGEIRYESGPGHH